MISVPFELEEVEFGMLIPGLPLPKKSQKECNLRKTQLPGSQWYVKQKKYDWGKRAHCKLSVRIFTIQGSFEKRLDFSITQHAINKKIIHFQQRITNRW